MIELARKELCTGCAACASACPNKCISMQEDAEGFLFPQIDRAKCISCQKCIKICPVLQEHKVAVQAAYAAVSHDDETRLKSSSGGVFSLLAELTIRNGGVVFGAAMQEDCSIAHIAVENLDDLPRLRGSKYVQSVIGDTYEQAKSFLQQGRQVLYSGTACQISGLCAFLGKPYDNLICQDIICYGVPSPGVWRKYLKGKNVKSVNFRDKSTLWRTYSVTYTYADGTQKIGPSGKDPFMRGFLGKLYLRKSCENCALKGCDADLTLGDCWGVEQIAPELDDNRGTSVIIVRTQKGAQILDQISDRLTMQPIDYEQVRVHNPAVYRPAAPSDKRDKFYKHPDVPLERIVDKLTRPSRLVRWKGRVRAVRSRIVRLIRSK